MHETVAALQARGVAAEVFTADQIPGYRRTPWAYVDSRRCRSALCGRLRAFDPDVVHLHNFYHELSPGILATLGRWRDRAGVTRPRRIVMTVHDHHLICPNSGLLSVSRGELVPADPARLHSLRYLLSRGWDYRGLRYSLLKLAQHLWNYRLHRRRRVIDVVICPSRYMRTLLDGFGFATIALPHPLPPAPTGVRRSGDELRFVFAGRVEPEKGLERFLELLPENFPGRLDVIGEGSSLAECRRIRRRRRLEAHVRFAGRLTRSETVERIAAAHVLVLSSLCPENAPMSLLEALAVGTNILVSNLGGAREVVQRSGVGFFFRPDDAGSLREALDGIDRARADGTLNAFDVSAYLEGRTQSAYVEQLVDVYANALSASASDG